MEVPAKQLHAHQSKEVHDEQCEDAQVEERKNQLAQHLQNELDTCVKNATAYKQKIVSTRHKHIKTYTEV